MGVLSQYEERQIAHLVDAEGDARADRCFDLVLRLVRRNEVSWRSLVRLKAQVLAFRSYMLVFAFTYLSPAEYGHFLKTVREVVVGKIGVAGVHLKLPFGTIRARGATHCFARTPPGSVNAAK